jgi:hypothetical protein
MLEEPLRSRTTNADKCEGFDILKSVKDAVERLCDGVNVGHGDPAKRGGRPEREVARRAVISIWRRLPATSRNKIWRVGLRQ